MIGHRKIFQTTIALCMFICMAALATGTMAQEVESVHILAEESGAYALEKQIFVAQGDVQVTYGSTILKGDKLHADLATGELILEGDVSLGQDGQEIHGEYLTYSLETRRGSFEQPQTDILLPEDTGAVFLSGQALDFEEGKYSVANAKVTTCDLEESHYHLATKELEYFIDEKVVIRGVTYYEGKIPLFYWPYLVIRLDSDWDAFNLPVFGYSEHEGFFMKNMFNYHLSPRAYGHIYLDLFTRLGVGAGVRHYYDLEKWGKGEIYLYGLPNRESHVYQGALTHEWTRNSLAFKTSTSYENSWQKEEFRSQNRLTWTLPRLSAETWFNYTRTPQQQTTEETDLGLKWAQSLTDNWRFNLEGSLMERQTDRSLRMLDYLASTQYRQGNHTFSLIMQQQFNPDLLEDQTQPWRSLQRIPELKWEASDLGLDKLPLAAQVTWGRYGERPSYVTQNRLFSQLRLRPQVWRPFSGTTINYQGDVNAAFYTEGQRQVWTYGRVALTQRITSSLQFQSTARRRDVWGTTPFRFDLQQPLQDVTLRLSHNDDKWRNSINTSYNFITNQFGTLTVQTNLRPNQNWNLNLYTTVDVNQRQFVRLVPMVEYKNDNIDLGLGGRYRPTTNTIERVDARISLPIGSTWQISYDSIYEPPKEAFTKGQISVTKDLHCRELMVSYDHVQGRVALQLTINAFPTLPIGWDSESGVSLFDLEDVTDIIGVEE